MVQTVTKEDVEQALKKVIDPEVGLNVVDLGLIYEINIDADTVHIVMTMTTVGCPAQHYLQGGAQAAVASLPGVEKVIVQVVWYPSWSPELISEAGRKHLGWQ